MKKLVFTLFIFCLALSSFADQNQLVVAKANKAYTDGLYTNAAELYQKVLDSGYESWEVYYNLGNCYFKINDISKAILFYERARKLDPGNEDINYNLKVSNSRITDKIEPLPELFYKKWYRSLVELFSVDTWSKITVMLFLGSLILALLYFIPTRIILRKAGFWSAIMLFLFSLISAQFAYQNYRAFHDSSEAIIFAPTVTVKSSPDEKSIDLFVLHEGSKVQVLDNIGTWYEIRIANGSVGWLPVAAIEKI